MDFSGTCGELIRTKDWSNTPLGPSQKWPPALRVLVQTVLRSRHPMLLFWGPELIQFYNDAFLPSFGEGKHPQAMGQPARECWSEVWGIVGAEIEGVISDGTPTWHADTLVPIYRNHRIEEVYWTYGYSPAFGETGNIEGVLVVCTETTRGVLANRRLELLARIGESVSTSATLADVIAGAFSCCERLTLDIPFAAALYPDGNEISPGYGLDQARRDTLRRTLVQYAAHATEPLQIALDNPISIPDWPEPATSAFVIPFLDGRIAFGISPRLPFDDSYRQFLIQLVDTLHATHKRVEAVTRQLRIERERRDLLMQAPVAAALLTGPDLMFELANPRYVEMVGREVEGRPFADAFPEAVDAPVFDVLTRAYRNGSPYSADEMCVQFDRDGSGTLQEAFFKFNLEPIRDGSGEVFGLMVVAVDITEIVSARRALERAHAERAALVERLEAASRAKDEFLAMLGHEMRNPLAPIVTALEVIKMRDDSAFVRERTIIERQTSHLIRLVDDLLDIARIVGGKIELKKKVCDLSDLVARAVEIAEYVIQDHHHELAVTIPEPISWWGDPDRLAQVISNLLTNAARYTDPGGRIELSAVKSDGTITIRVTDNGKGLDPTMIDRVFEMFTQGRQEMDRGQGGLGLGLTLTKTLVELHGGTVSVSSEGPGRGSTFAVHLPVVAATSSEGHPKAHVTANPKRILVVDDNPDVAETLRMWLETEGHTVEVANDGITALRAYQRFRPEVALLDLGLPVMDGYELARRMSEQDENGSCPLIAITGYGQSSDRAKSADAGFYAHLVKPVDLDTLRRTIAKAPVEGATQPKANDSSTASNRS